MKKFFSTLILLIFTTSCLPATVFADGIANKNEDKQINTMAIAMATDNNFVLPTIVAMTSILENANADSFYKFYILKSSDLETKNEEKFLNLKNRYKGRCLIKFFKMSNEFDKERTLKHITAPTFFRLRLPSLLQNEEKCLYLDGDIIVQKDLWKLYNTDIKNYYIAGVKGAGAQKAGQKLAKKLNTPDVKKYVNAGILLMNLKKMRQDNIEQKFNEFIPLLNKRKLTLADQDVINSVCYEKIYNLPLRYNTIPKYCDMDAQHYKKYKFLENFFTIKEFKEAITNPVIIHYATSQKPWYIPTVRFGNLWWYYAQKTDYFKEIKQKYAPQAAHPKNKSIATTQRKAA